MFCCLFAFTGFAEPSVLSKHKGSALFVCFSQGSNKANGMANEPHIGHLIKEELRNQGRTITWLAKQLDCSRQNAYKILNRPWIYTDLLLKISNILDYDFFKCFSDYRNMTLQKPSNNL